MFKFCKILYNLLTYRWIIIDITLVHNFKMSATDTTPKAILGLTRRPFKIHNLD